MNLPLGHFECSFQVDMLVSECNKKLYDSGVSVDEVVGVMLRGGKLLVVYQIPSDKVERARRIELVQVGAFFATSVNDIGCGMVSRGKKDEDIFAIVHDEDKFLVLFKNKAIVSK